jgi:hypothetical protein
VNLTFGRPDDVDYWSSYHYQSNVSNVTLSVTWNDPPKAATPQISPSEGIFVGTSPVITISDATPGATIRYTTDGSGASSSYGSVYTGPFTLTASGNVTAVAYAPAYSTSDLANRYSGGFTLLVGPPAFGLAGGTYPSAQTVALTSVTPGVAIRYTLDGTTPTSTSGTLYTGPIAISSSKVIKAVAYRAGWTTSRMSSASYTIAAPLTGFSYSRSISIDHTKVSNTNQADFPVLISGTYGYLATVANGGRVQSPNGYDIAFASDPSGNTRLDSEIETYDPATGRIVAWVRVPLLSASADTAIYVFYGNGAVSSTLANPSRCVGRWVFGRLAPFEWDRAFCE